MSSSRTASFRPADNPFASHRVDALPYRGPAISWHDLEHRIDALGGRAAIVGPKGSGKTTLLEAFAHHLQQPAVVVHLPGSDPRPHRTAIRQLPDPVTSDHTILIDSAEQLGPLAWRHLLTRTRRARRLVATFHRPGRLPTLIECTTDPDLLRKLVRELAPDESATLDPTIEGLFNRHRGNIRSCLRDLYDVYAGRSLPADHAD